MYVDTHGTLVYVSERFQLTAPFKQTLLNRQLRFCCRQIWTLLHVPLVFILTGLYSCSLSFEQENNYLHVELTLIYLFIIVLVNNTYN